MGKFKERQIRYLGDYVDSNGIVDHAKMAQDRIWLTQGEITIPYEDLEDQHLNHIIMMFNNNKLGKSRLIHEVGIRREYLRRNTKAGQVLFTGKQ